MIKTLLSSLLVTTLAGTAAGLAGEPAVRVASDGLAQLAVPAEIGTVMVANPAIADVTPIDRQRLVVVGRRPGATTLLVFSKTGVPLLETTVLVVPNETRTVRVHRGATESTLTCAPRCAPTEDATPARPEAAKPAAAADTP